MIFCGAGLVALPLDMIREFLGRPKACITKSEYMTRAKALGNKAKGIMVSNADCTVLSGNGLKYLRHHDCSFYSQKLLQEQQWCYCLCNMSDSCHAVSILLTLKSRYSAKSAQKEPAAQTKMGQDGHAANDLQAGLQAAPTFRLKCRHCWQLL